MQAGACPEAFRIADYFFDDLHVYDPASAVWTDLTSRMTGANIPGRCGHGFVAGGGLLFVFYGSGNVGELSLSCIQREHLCCALRPS